MGRCRPVRRHLVQVHHSASGTPVRKDGPACARKARVYVQDGTLAGFTAAERDFIRREPDMFFSTFPRVADGFQLKTWRGGPQAGQPKLSPMAKSLLNRGMMRLDATQHLPRLFFTELGLLALRTMMADGRLANPETFAHLRHELGIEPDLDPEAAE